MLNPPHRHDISDEVWGILEAHLPGQTGHWGGVAKDNRRFVNAVFWVLKTGSPWRDLPLVYGKWGTVHQRFIRWRDKHVWEKILELLLDEPGFEWLLPATGLRAVSPQAAAKNNAASEPEQSPMAPRPRAWPWLRMICQSEALLQILERRILFIQDH